MRLGFYFLFLILSIAKLQSQDYSHDIFFKYLLELKLDSAEHYLSNPDIDQGYLDNLLSLVKNVGNVDSMRIFHNDENVHLSTFLKGIYNLFRTDSTTSSYLQLRKSLLFFNEKNHEGLEKLTLFFILELYSREIFQISNKYETYLKRFSSLRKNEVDSAWYSLFSYRFVTKHFDYYDEKTYNQAFGNLKNSFLKLDPDSPLLSYLYHNEGIQSRLNGKYQLAIQMLNKVEISSYNILYLNYVNFVSELTLCQLHSFLGDVSSAKRHLEKSKSYFDEIDLNRYEYLYNRFAAIYYYDPLKFYDSAYLLLKMAEAIEPRLNAQKNSIRISELSIELETQEKENEILRQGNQISAQNRLLIIVFVFVFILLILSLVLIYAFRNIRHKNLKIETLMRELHHRVKNNLQVISSLLGLQSMKLEDKAAKKAVSEGKGRIRAMSLIHQKLYQNQEVTSLNIKEYINNLVLELAQSYGYKEKTNIIIEAPEKDFDADTSLPIGLIINELVSNAFKYAFDNVKKPQLMLNLKAVDGKYYMLLISDNGKGLPSDFQMEKTTSFGMKLVNLLVKQLKGTMEVSNENGLSYEIKFQLG